MSLSKLALVLLCLCLVPLSTSRAEDVSGQTGIGLEIGLMKLVGGSHDYSNVDQELGIYVRRGLKPHWSLQASFNTGWLHPKNDVPEPNEQRVPSLERLYSVIWHARLEGLYHLRPQKSFSPFFGLGLGVTWNKVKDMRGADGFGGIFPGGPSLYGFNENGDYGKLSQTSFTLTLSAGLEYFIRSTFAMNGGIRYNYMPNGGWDNIGLSNEDIYGAEAVDANQGLMMAYLGFTWYFGNRDRDGDGIENKFDACPDQAEDFDGYQDRDGCPEPDNDADGIFDVVDQCPDVAEDFDGYRDEDGCPDLDNDGDGIPDSQDECRNEAEDFDGYMDEDGCPDPDNDGDGVPDELDECPGTPADLPVDETGCPLVEEIGATVVLEGVNFVSGSAELTGESAQVLDEVVESLLAYPSIAIEVQGHTDSHGASSFNNKLSQQRADAVRDYLIRGGVPAEQVTAMGYGERYPIATNQTAEGRALNRRVELHRMD